MRFWLKLASAGTVLTLGGCGAAQPEPVRSVYVTESAQASASTAQTAAGSQALQRSAQCTATVESLRQHAIELLDKSAEFRNQAVWATDFDARNELNRQAEDLLQQSVSIDADADSLEASC